eukprot:2140515-Pyramimonas_sp.AAC.1
MVIGKDSKEEHSVASAASARLATVHAPGRTAGVVVATLRALAETMWGGSGPHRAALACLLEVLRQVPSHPALRIN